MDELKEFISRIKLVRMRTPNIAKVAIILVIVLCMGALIGLRLAINDLKGRTADRKNDAAQLIGENQELDEKIDQVGSIQSVVDIAKEELGLVEPGTVIFETGPAPATESAEGN